MSSYPIPATRSPELPSPCWRAWEPAQLEPVPSLRPLVSWLPLRRLLLSRKFPRQLLVRPQSLPAANDLRHDLLDCDDGAAFVVSVHPLWMPRLLPRQTQVRVLGPVPLSTGGAPVPREQSLEPRAAHPHYRRTSAATVRARWSLLWWNLLRASCGASSARSSIYAYSCL